MAKKTQSNSSNQKDAAQDQNTQGAEQEKPKQAAPDGAAEQSPAANEPNAGGKDQATPPATTTAPAKSTDQVEVLRITAKADQFCRGGRRFGRAERVIRAEDFEPEQLARLRDEPMLVVVEDTVDPAEITG